jgi:hypothetical protein
MITRFGPLSIAMAILLLLPGASQSKGITIQLTITGPQLALPLHTDDPEAIAAMVWGTNFFDEKEGPVVDPQNVGDRLTIHFWIRLPDDSVQMKYVVWYTWLSQDNYAVVCFPGSRQSYWYRINTFSILREGVDGRCFRAEERWGHAIRRLVNGFD